MKKKWTLSDINFLIKHYSEVGGPSICSEELNRSLSSVHTKAGRLGIKHISRWSDNQINFLIDNYKSIGADKCSVKLNKDINSVYHMVNKLGIGTSNKVVWSEYELDILRTYYSEYGAEYCLNKLNRSLGSIRLKANKLGLSCIHDWSDYEVNFLISNYITMGPKLISNELGITKGSIATKVKELGLVYRDTESFIKISKITHYDKYDYSKVFYKGANTKVIIICPYHGEFKQTPASHFSGRGCPICKESKGELYIRDYLEENGVNFKQQHTFINCRNINELPFDFYLSDLNMCIEYHGKQHYEPIDFFGGEQTLIKIKERDKIKSDFCNSNGIGLVVIKYDEPILERLNVLF